MLDTVADLLADPPDDLLSQYLKAVRRATGAASVLLFREMQNRAARFSGLDEQGAVVPASPATSRWLASLPGEGIADAAPGSFGPAAAAVVAHRRSRDGLVAVVALTEAGDLSGDARGDLLLLARFAPAVLRQAGEGARAAARPISAEAARLEQFGRASPDIFWIYDARTLVPEYVSPAFEAIHGRPAAEAIGAAEGVDADTVAEDRAAARASAERAADGEIGLIEYRIRRASDDAVRWIRAADFPLRNLAGEIERVGRIARDITEFRAAAEDSRRLQQEIQHRVRNALGVIRALVRRTAETSDTLEDLASHLDGRINAFARVQSALARHPTAGLDLEHLLADEILTSTLHQPGRVTLKGPAVSLTPKAAETLGLILHELATNAVEHGALGTEKGRLRVSWEIRPDRTVPRLVIEWTERGGVHEAGRPTHRGFGTELLEKTLPYELNGVATLSFERQGLRCLIEVPLTPLVLARSV